MRLLSFIILLFIGFVSTTPAQAQQHLEGLWDGSMSLGGIDAPKNVKVQFYLKMEGKKVTGRSYVHLTPKKVIEMELTGYIHQDRSIYLEEVEFIPPLTSEYNAPYNRKYQFLYNRGLEGSSLEGYWQEELSDDPLKEERVKGKIVLNKKESGA